MTQTISCEEARSFIENPEDQRFSDRSRDDLKALGEHAGDCKECEHALEEKHGREVVVQLALAVGRFMNNRQHGGRMR